MVKQINDKYYGRKDICLYAAKIVQDLFPTNSSTIVPSSSKTSFPAPLPEWYAYLLLRTDLSNSIVFHAIHLLRKLASAFVIDEEMPSPLLLQYQLLYTATILATNYNMDDCYSNASWSTASRSLFSLSDTNAMQMTMLENLDYVLRIEPEEIEEIELEWEKEKMMAIEKVKKLAFTLSWPKRQSSPIMPEKSDFQQLHRVPSIRGF